MKLILKIAKTELKNLFYSPVAWFLTVVFTVICGVFYAVPLERLATMQEVLQAAAPSFMGFPFSFTSLLIVGEGTPLIGNAINNLYLFIPLLTMGVFSKEFNNGTFKLLYSSPVRVNQIVWGKYVAILVYNMLLSLIMLAFIVAAAFSIKDFEYEHVLVGLIAFYLVACAYTAIGLFMSSITNYPIIAALATFILLFALQQVGTLWQQYDVMREITYFLSISGRADRMQSGLLTTRDVMYYVLVTYFFVTCSYLNLKHGREVVSKFKIIYRFAVVFCAVLLVGYLSSIPGYVGYWDATREKVNTITSATQEIMKGFDKEAPLEVTLYTNLLDRRGNGFEMASPRNRNHYVWNVWDPFVRFNPNIKLNYVLFYDIKDGDSSLFKHMPGMSLDAIAAEIAKMNVTNYNKYLKPADIRAKIDLSNENYNSIMRLQYKGKTIFLRTYKDPQYWPNEAHFAAAFKRLINDTIPTIYNSTGHYERSIHKSGGREFTTFSVDKENRHALINNGFELDTLNLNVQEIPKDAVAVVLADPKMELSGIVESKLDEHISSGGNLLVLGEPGKQAIVNEVLDEIGVQLKSGTMVQISTHETPDKITPHITLDYSGLIAAHTPLMEKVRNDYPHGGREIGMHPGVAPVEVSDAGFTIHKMWVTHPEKQVWVKVGNLVTDSAPPVLDTRMGDYMLDSFNVAVALEREINNKVQKIVVAGDADFLSNNRPGTHFSGVDYLSWMSNEMYPIRVFRKASTDNMLHIGITSAETQKLIFIWIFPGVLIVIGSLLLMRRKRQ